MTCEAEGCEREVLARGLCRKHYARAFRAGLPPRPTREERFWSKVDTPAAGCWLWLAHVNRATGYGDFQGSPSHRVSYELSVGPIPAGYQIDHLCRVRACVRPDHLEAVTPAENNRRSDSPWGLRARQTHCVHGHEFTPENTYVRKEGWRMCRTCGRERQAS